MIQVGSKWKCTDEDLEQFGLTGEILDVADHPDLNGDGDLEIQYEDGSTMVMKVRRFYMRHQQVKD